MDKRFSKPNLTVSLLVGLTFFSTQLFAATADRLIKDAEKLLLNQDRVGAFSILQKGILTSNKSDTRVLKMKLQQFGKTFFTDRGFQDFQVGKDLFLKRKYADAADKLQESFETEGPNFEVVRYLILSNVALNKPAPARNIFNKNNLYFAFDMELQRAALSLLIVEEKWQDALKSAESLQRDFNDESVTTLKEKAMALMELKLPLEAKRVLEQIIVKDKNFPEAYYLLGVLAGSGGTSGEGERHFAKYLDLCKQIPEKKYEREVKLCKKVDEASEKVKKSKI